MAQIHFHSFIQMGLAIVARRYLKCANQEEAMQKLTELNELFDRLDQELLNMPESGSDMYMGGGGSE